ncbi:uncharacterized protein LOC122498922 [Leptopilina heterotoma]|uniref:uncharacterized protein LOC122498922 n=1 Tax=Leptopilina heterotoma TaxID=63436 RepID=UPI001CA81BA6|nr:uncharacterized protein LOC122498922 [Leptopilina heterotoma]
MPNPSVEIPLSDRLRPSWRHFEVGGFVNELGLAWDPVQDQFRFSAPNFDESNEITKRKALSEFAKLFDPLGWLAPLVVVGKMLIQDLWKAKLSWDERIPASMMSYWNMFRENVKKVHQINIPRYINYEPNSQIELHLFTDASRRAMAAAVYSRTSSSHKQMSTPLIAARTKLSPIKSLNPSKRPVGRVTIPRLELRAALLGAKLLKAQAEVLCIELNHCTGWSDSQVVIRWLSSNQPVGNDLVDNYISHIQELLPDFKWRYVPTSENPADVATRGSDVENLSQHPLWSYGPPWLKKAKDAWPKESILQSKSAPISEISIPIQCHITQANPTILDRF